MSKKCPSVEGIFWFLAFLAKKRPAREISAKSEMEVNSISDYIFNKKWVAL